MSRLHNILDIPEVVCTDEELELAVRIRSENIQNLVVMNYLHGNSSIVSYCKKYKLDSRSFVRTLRQFALEVCQDFEPVEFPGLGKKVSAKFYTFLKMNGVPNLMEFVQHKAYIKSCIKQLDDNSLLGEYNKLTPFAFDNMVGFIIKSKEGNYLGKSGVFWSNIAHARIYKTWETAKEDVDSAGVDCKIVEVCLVEVE